ncbi:protein MIZU-KUSSEI 1 [Mercurialis annua]|uniref:protein MIZU-KUSSEI 1 n=1 Tax=Mercurialis annua TaxID=3986 RepID=UPI00215E731C|nr:protein MIZU-KUSSEI 1 [Mercurialis annua]
MPIAIQHMSRLLPTFLIHSIISCFLHFPFYADASNNIPHTPSWPELLPTHSHILSLIYSLYSSRPLLKNTLYLASAMRMMIDLGNQTGSLLSIIDAPTSVDCGRPVRFRRSFRSLVECMVPCCGFQPSHSYAIDSDSTTVTGTFFGYRKGRVSFCLQEDTRTSPLLLLEFAVPTSYLAREMQYGLLRIALECDRQKESSSWCSLFRVPVWSMYCNGRKVGFAIRRQLSGSDAGVLKLMQSVSVGAGVLPVPPMSEDGELMYLRATFQRVIGSADSESFHMMNPVGSSGQELSIFLLRS